LSCAARSSSRRIYYATTIAGRQQRELRLLLLQLSLSPTDTAAAAGIAHCCADLLHTNDCAADSDSWLALADRQRGGQTWLTAALHRSNPRRRAPSSVGDVSVEIRR